MSLEPLSVLLCSPPFVRRGLQTTHQAFWLLSRVPQDTHQQRKVRFSRMNLILFGSYAKVTAHADSDMDVAIIVNELKTDYFITRPLLWKIRREIDDRIEPILLEKDSDDSGFITEIIKHGIII